MMIVRNTPNERQGFALGLLATAIWGGSMLGNVCCGLIIHYLGYRTSFWICGIMYFLAGFAVLFTRDDAVKFVPPPQKEKKSFSWKSLLPQLSKQIWIILGLFIVIVFVRYFEIPYIAMKVKNIIGIETADYWTGIISAFVCLGAVISGAGIGYLSDRFPAGKLLLPIFFFSAVGLVMQGMAYNLWLFGIGRVLLYTAAGGLPSVIQKILATITPKEKRGTAFGLASTFNGIGIMLATCVSSTTLILIGCDGVFYVTAALFMISMPFSFLCISKATKLHESTDIKE